MWHELTDTELVEISQNPSSRLRSTSWTMAVAHAILVTERVTWRPAPKGSSPSSHSWARGQNSTSKGVLFRS